VTSPKFPPREYFYEEQEAFGGMRSYMIWTKDGYGEWMGCGWMGELTEFRGCFNEFTEPIQLIAK
jgi:hypothetical protein